LIKVWDGTASEDEQASLDFYLLDVRRAEGSRGIIKLLRGFPPERLGSITVSESGAEVLCTVLRDDSPPLLISTCADPDPDMGWVMVAVEPTATSFTADDPRHVAFYTMWEGFLENDANKDDVREQAVFLIGLLEMEVMNGGLGQYLTNTDGAHLTETLDCLERIGASKTRELLIAAAKLGAKAESYVAAWDDESEAFSSLDDEFYDSGEDLAGLTADTFLDF
jgi:hypothetical protein